MINYKMGSREIGKLRKWAKEHSLPPIYWGRVCKECRKFDKGYCNKWLTYVDQNRYACIYFSPLVRIGPTHILKIIIACEKLKYLNKFYKELDKLIEREGLKKKRESIRKKQIKENDHTILMYKTVISIFNPPDGFGTKLNKLLERFQKEIDIKVECI